MNKLTYDELSEKMDEAFRRFRPDNMAGWQGELARIISEAGWTSEELDEEIMRRLRDK